LVWLLQAIIAQNHPSILVKTDLNENFEIYRMSKKTIYKAKFSLEEALKQ